MKPIAVDYHQPIIGALRRKTRRVLDDPVLRTWLIGRALGRNPGVAPFAAHRPPYLEGLAPGGNGGESNSGFAELARDAPTGPIELPLAGITLRLEPGDQHDLFARRFDDIEDLLALHRFAWLPVLGEAADPAWAQALWTAWRRDHGKPGEGWPWHPYTAAERAVNMLAFGRRRGLPGPLGDTLEVLAAHGPAIFRRLEYFGDHNTSNHLSNNGRGLYLLGLELGDSGWADIGARILIEEAKRIFTPSGILCEGSSHYHMLLTRNYIEVWRAAAAHRRPEEAELGKIATRALAAARSLVLPGGLALIGDISPDCPPALPAGVAELPGNGAELDALAADGWLRADFGRWSGLWHASPWGWSAMPGHGHQDCGGFEVHFAGEPLFCDLGRGRYGESGEAAFYRSAAAHNGLLIDGLDSYPPNRPYYDDAFRRRICGPPPVLARHENGVMLRHHGFSRLGGVGAVERHWRFSGSGFSIADRVEGRGWHRVSRLLHTTLPVEGTVIGGKFRITAEGDTTTEAVTCWQAYGRGRPATAIRIEATVRLPWEQTITVDII
ncbi:MAG TPA: hypothetical protein ENI55_06090 [Alphaproteobacteria bacterium]|nr:hypothetical protein [Alphaproteobacteria bacterium]